jgi:hypothetical protein
VITPDPVTRLPSRSPPDDLHRQKQPLRAAFMRGVVADVLGGEAKETGAYISALPARDRHRAHARREERAEAVHRLVLRTLFWVGVLVATIAMTAVASIIVVAFALHAVFLSWGPSGPAQLLLKVGCPSVFLAGSALVLRRRRPPR